MTILMLDLAPVPRNFTAGLVHMRRDVVKSDDATRRDKFGIHFKICSDATISMVPVDKKEVDWSLHKCFSRLPMCFFQMRIPAYQNDFLAPSSKGSIKRRFNQWVAIAEASATEIDAHNDCIFYGVTGKKKQRSTRRRPNLKNSLCSSMVKYLE